MTLGLGRDRSGTSTQEYLAASQPAWEPLATQVTPRAPMQPDLSVQALPRGVIRLSKTESANAERIFELTIPISGTDVAPARWAVNGSSVPPWLSLPLLQGSIGATHASGNLSLTASTTN